MIPELQETEKLLEKRFPIWVTLVITLLILAGAGVALYYFKTDIYNYTINIPEKEKGEIKFQYGATPALANPDYFMSVKAKFIEEKTNFIEADLSGMKVRVYSEGNIVKEVPILTKGKEGSWWETPAGLYKIESKESKHFSSIGKVYQPWSMAFQGNFFIHGWPYYPDGTPVSSTYSGGCIRLDTEDAKAIYNLAANGMPVLVYEKDFALDQFNYAQRLPDISAVHYLAADLKSGSVLLEKDLGTQAPIASITKLVTALVAAEYINLEKTIVITPDMIVPTSKPRLVADQEISVYNLMFPLLTESSNEAAEAISRQLGRNYFISLMNQKAASLGMHSTRFADPSGSSAENVSTSEDLFALARYIYNNRSFIFNISSGKLTSSVYGTSYYKNLGNFNIVQGVTDPFIGGKIGKTTAAGETYLGVFEIITNGEKRPIAVILLGSTDVYKDAAAIVQYIHETY